MADRDRHGTDQRGEKAYNAILATADVKMRERPDLAGTGAKGMPLVVEVSVAFSVLIAFIVASRWSKRSSATAASRRQRT
jgi:hypothetical protein